MKIRRLTIVLSVLFLSLFGLTPPAHAAPAPATLTINNSETDGTAITGGSYTATQVATIDPATGAQTPTPAPQPTVTIPEGTATSLNQYAVYEVVQTTRAPGYYLNTDPFTVEFPLMDGGQVAASQALVLNPKLVPITGNATLTKTANNTATPVAGATFDLYRTADENGTLAAPVLVTAGLTTNAAGQIQATDLPEGSYYFIETATVAPYAVDTTTQYPFTVTANAAGTGTEVIAPLTASNYTQPSQTTVTKASDVTTANVGQTVTFTVSAQMPLDIADYTTYTISDTLDSRYALVSATSPNAGVTTTTAGQTATATLAPGTVAPGSTVTMTVTATVNTTATGGDVVPNTANVTWDNGRGAAGTFATLAANVTITEGSLAVTKVDGTTAAVLPGATFILEDAAGNQLTDINGAPYEATSDAAGQLTFARLPFGTYYLRETVAPAGYRLPEQTTEITVSAANTNTAVTVENYTSASDYPTTGTLGPLPYFLAGGLLLGLFFYLRRRSRGNEA